MKMKYEFSKPPSISLSKISLQPKKTEVTAHVPLKKQRMTGSEPEAGSP